VTLNDARAAFTEQVQALVQGGPGVGVDLLLIETMTSLSEAAEAIRASQQVAPDLPIIVTMTVDEAASCLDGTTSEAAATHLTKLGADAVGCNCSHGPESILLAIRRMRTATHLPLAAMPNAGLPRFDGCALYAVSPNDMAVFTRRAISAGATLIGGCCGTTPEHIRAMKAALACKDSG
jgi:homocysteine S-methyltransferase